MGPRGWEVREQEPGGSCGLSTVGWGWKGPLAEGRGHAEVGAGPVESSLRGAAVLPVEGTLQGPGWDRGQLPPSASGEAGGESGGRASLGDPAGCAQGTRAPPQESQV